MSQESRVTLKEDYVLARPVSDTAKDFFISLPLPRRLLFGPMGGRSSIIGGPCVSPSARLRTGSASWSAIPLPASA